MKINWKYIAIFILIAIGISYPIQLGYLNDFYLSIFKKTFLGQSSYLLAGLSTLIAAIIALILHKGLSKRITIFGGEKIKNTLILSLPVIAFSIIGLDNQFGINKSLYGFAFASVNTLYAFSEELGWRRYLQNALEGLNKNYKYLLIAIIWWIWHFRFETQFDLFIFPAICIGGGYFLGKLADDTKSILPVVATHTLIILTTNAGTFGLHEITGIGAVILGWILIEWFWKKKKVG